MNVLVCLNGVGFTDYARQDLGNSQNCIDLIARSLGSVMGIGRLLVLCGPDGAESAQWIGQSLRTSLSKLDINTQILPDTATATALRAMADYVREGETILLCSAIAPFLHAGLTNTMLNNHATWHAEYTFADGFPLGLTPQIIRPRILPVVAKFAQDCQSVFSDPDAVFQSMKQDINAFEIETEIAPLDLRLLRINLYCNTRQNTQLCRNLLPVMQAQADNVEALLQAIQANQAGLRTLPSFFNIQVSAACPQVCSYCPWGQKGEAILRATEFMPAEKFLGLAKRIREFAPESVLSVSLWGEPSLNPEIWQIIEGMADLRPLQLYIETSGLSWDAQRLEEFAASPRNDHVTWIISLDAMDQAAYQAMRGQGWQEALAAAHLFVKLFPQQAYIQAVRCDLNDEGMQKHYQYWKKLGAKQIIQKYDHFSNTLPNRRLSDISPLDRYACWHLKRDMAILIDGRVPLCREDVKADHSLGNVFTQDLAAVWQEMDKHYRQHLEGRYSPICGACDEYFTFNH